MLHNTFPPRSNSAPKPLTATLMQEVITTHENFLKTKCTCQSTYGKSKFALKYSNGKAMPSGFSHFYCHRVVLSTQKNFEGFSNISGRLVATRWSPTAKNIVSGPPKIRTISGPCHLYHGVFPCVAHRHCAREGQLLLLDVLVSRRHCQFHSCRTLGMAERHQFIYLDFRS